MTLDRRLFCIPRDNLDASQIQKWDPFWKTILNNLFFTFQLIKSQLARKVSQYQLEALKKNCYALHPPLN